MQDRKAGHFDAEEEGGNADFDIGVGEDFIGVNEVECSGAETDGYGLPEGEKDYQLDGEDFEEGLVGFELWGVSELDVKLDKAVHCDCHRYGLDDDNLRGGLDPGFGGKGMEKG